MKVVKFGGSSLASADQLKKVFDIVKSDPERKIVIVSAPGKRSAGDIKVTDLLIHYYESYKNGEALSSIQSQIILRYQDIYDEFHLTNNVMDEIRDNILNLAKLPIAQNKFLYDTFLAAGENNNARLIASIFTKLGLESRYVHPSDAGISVTADPGNARLLPGAYDNIRFLRELDETLIIPGFFGMTEQDEVCTFSRGGSDITGSIVAAGVKADLYENFTDVDGLFAAHPGIVKNPHSIKELTYREMRELAYAGFNVLHNEALVPAYRAGVPLVIKNTNNPSHPGTSIVVSRDNDEELPVVGIASSSGFSMLYVSKYLMNRELGFGRRVLNAMENLGVSFEHMPTGIDDLSVVYRSRYTTQQIEKTMVSDITETLHPDEIFIKKGFSVITIVGEHMKGHLGVMAKAMSALAEQEVNIEMVTQGASEVSIMVIVKEKDEPEALKAIYGAFF